MTPTLSYTSIGSGYWTRLRLWGSLSVFALLLAACASAPPAAPAASTNADATAERTKAIPLPQLEAYGVRDHWQPVSFDAITGWAQDEHRQVWSAYQKSCRALRFRAEWRTVCELSKTIDSSDNAAVKQYFEANFQPFLLIADEPTDKGLATGYYEPILRGSLSRREPFIYPLYRRPSDLLTVNLREVAPSVGTARLRGRVLGQEVVPYFSREEITNRNLLQGFEIVWLEDPVDAFFMEIQGSGRVSLSGTDRVMRLGYADQNGWPYRSIGRYLVQQGQLPLAQASAQNIKKWVRANPDRLNEVLNHNPSVVFFEEKAIDNPAEGPIGALGVNLTPGRSVAIDPLSVPLGAPVFIDSTYPNKTIPLQRLVMAQDTGGAIRGKVRIDFYWGSGDSAGELAGQMRQTLRKWVLMPKLPLATTQ